MECITSDGLKLFYEKRGEGVPCIYLHGGPGYWSKSFQYFSEGLLEENLEMIYLDQRGCGRSEYSSTQSYSLNRLITDIEELRLHLGIRTWYIMGHSFGGILAVNYAIRFPENTRGLILSNATLHMFDSFEYQIRKGYKELGMEVRRLQQNDVSSLMENFYFMLSKLIEKDIYFTFQYADTKNKTIIDQIDEGLNSDSCFQQYVFSSEEYFQDFTSLTKGISHPVLVLAGKHDHAVGPEHHQRFNFNNQDVLVLEGSHHPYIENQSDFKDAIINFIEK